MMISRLTKALLLNKSISHFTNSKPPLIKPKPIQPKGPTPTLKLKSGQLHLSKVAEELNLNEETLRKQLIDPKARTINK